MHDRRQRQMCIRDSPEPKDEPPDAPLRLD
jgi:hypothetical protein